MKRKQLKNHVHTSGASPAVGTPGTNPLPPRTLHNYLNLIDSHTTLTLQIHHLMESAESTHPGKKHKADLERIFNNLSGISTQLYDIGNTLVKYDETGLLRGFDE